MKRFATSVLAALAVMGPTVAAQESRPRLVVGIVVDQLRTDYIEYLQNYFGERGFNTLLREGAYIRDLDFKVPDLDAAEATAMLFTGAYPSQTGITSALVYDRERGGAMMPPLLVPGATGSITNDSFTPAPLRLSTISDELAVDASGLAQIYSVAMDPQQAVIMAGHAGSGAFWVNNTSGNWATTSYYGSLPSLLSMRNMRTPLSQRIDTMQWRPSARFMGVAGISDRKKQYPFRYQFSRGDRDLYKKFAASPLSNVEVTDVAIDIIKSMNLGRNPSETDMLNIAYTVAPFKYGKDSDTRAELTDSYLRLDGQLARLFDAIDSTVGRGNAVIWLTSTGYFDEAVVEDERFRIPGGEFSLKRARSLLNSYLSARHGSAGYVGAIRDGQIFLDRKVLESMRLDPEEVIEDAKGFILKMSGVADAYSIYDITDPATDEERNLRLAVDPRNSGDIYVRFAPGWNVVDEEQTPPSSKPVRESSVMTPAFLLAPGIGNVTVAAPVEAVRLAPTLSGALRIRAPNGARARALQLKPLSSAKQ